MRWSEGVSSMVYLSIITWATSRDVEIVWGRFLTDWRRFSHRGGNDGCLRVMVEGCRRLVGGHAGTLDGNVLLVLGHVRFFFQIGHANVVSSCPWMSAGNVARTSMFLLWNRTRECPCVLCSEDISWNNVYRNPIIFFIIMYEKLIYYQ
jgi:hypothetical protein